MPPDHSPFARIGGESAADRAAVDLFQYSLRKLQNIEGGSASHVAGPTCGGRHSQGKALWKPFIGHLDRKIFNIEEIVF
jgi:hypothetical protein